MAVVSTVSSFEQRRVFESTEMKPQTKSLGIEYVYIYLKKKSLYMDNKQDRVWYKKDPLCFV